MSMPDPGCHDSGAVCANATFPRVAETMLKPKRCRRLHVGIRVESKFISMREPTCENMRRTNYQVSIGMQQLWDEAVERLTNWMSAVDLMPGECITS